MAYKYNDKEDVFNDSINGDIEVIDIGDIDAFEDEDEDNYFGDVEDEWEEK